MLAEVSHDGAGEVWLEDIEARDEEMSARSGGEGGAQGRQSRRSSRRWSAKEPWPSHSARGRSTFRAWAVHIPRVGGAY